MIVILNAMLNAWLNMLAFYAYLILKLTFLFEPEARREINFNDCKKEIINYAEETLIK